MGGFCLLVESHQEGSGINGATLSSYFTHSKLWDTFYSLSLNSGSDRRLESLEPEHNHLTFSRYHFTFELGTYEVLFLFVKMCTLNSLNKCT